MTLISHNVARIFYTEYKVKASETLKQIARDQLHDEKFAAEIKFKWDPAAKNTVIIQGAVKAGEILLIPPVPTSLLNKHPKAISPLNELKAKAEKGAITVDQYYEQRKMLLSVL